MRDWLIIGISGVTCGGKSTLANLIHTKIANSILINQDDYFLPDDSPKHVYVPELNHVNYDIISSLDMEKMCSDVSKKLQNFEKSKTVKVMIIEGFCIFDHKLIFDLCDLRYFMTLDKEICRARRKLRTYIPPDVDGYFELIVWPEYLKCLANIADKEDTRNKIQIINGSQSVQCILDKAVCEIESEMKSRNCNAALEL